MKIWLFAWRFVLDRLEDRPHIDTWPDLHSLKTPHPREHVSLRAPLHTGACPRQGWPYTCPISSLITRRITRRRLWSTYIRVNLLHPQGTHHFHNTSYTVFLSFITDLSVKVLTCLQAPFVPPRRLIVAVPKAITITPEHSLPPFPLNRSHWTDQDCYLIVFHGLMYNLASHLCVTECNLNELVTHLFW